MTKGLRCATCGGRLQFVAVEQDGDTSYICTNCGDEWFGSTVEEDTR